MKKYSGLIQESLLLSSIPTEKVNSCLKDGSFRIGTHGKNNIIHFPGDLCSRFEIILSGHVAVENIDEAGNLMGIADFYSNEILGGNLLFSQHPYYPMTITAKRPTIIVNIDRERLMELFLENPLFLRKYLEFTADHTLILGNHIKRYTGKTIRESMMDYLQHEQQRQGTSIIRIPVTKKALAERMGVSRTSLSRELAKMRKDGLIRYDAAFIEIL